jgi:hypothetical protein
MNYDQYSTPLPPEMDYPKTVFGLKFAPPPRKKTPVSAPTCAKQPAGCLCGALISALAEGFRRDSPRNNLILI